MILPSAKAVGYYFFAGGMGRALHSYCIAFLGAHGHGHGFNDTWASGAGTWKGGGTLPTRWSISGRLLDTTQDGALFFLSLYVDDGSVRAILPPI